MILKDITLGREEKKHMKKDDLLQKFLEARELGVVNDVMTQEELDLLEELYPDLFDNKNKEK